MFEFSVCGVRCRLSLLFPALLTVLLLCQPDGPAVACVLASLVHEGGHLLAMMLVGVPPEECTLSAFGVRIGMRYHKLNYIQNIFISLAGPLTNGVAAGLLWWCGALVPALAHLVLAALNLLPSAALDGGQVLRCGLCMIGLSSFAERILQITSAVILLLLASVSFIMLFQGRGNLSLLVVCGYLAALTFFSDKMQKKHLTRTGGAGIIIGTNEAERRPLSPPGSCSKGLILTVSCHEIGGFLFDAGSATVRFFCCLFLLRRCFP